MGGHLQGVEDDGEPYEQTDRSPLIHGIGEVGANAGLRQDARDTLRIEVLVQHGPQRFDVATGRLPAGMIHVEELTARVVDGPPGDPRGRVEKAWPINMADQHGRPAYGVRPRPA